MASFSLLPAELVEFVASYSTQADLYALSRVNKSLSTLAMPYLYRHVDQVIHPGEKIPRIDRFCFNILNDPRRAARVETLRLGPSSENGVKEGQRWLPKDKHFDDEALYEKAMVALSDETLITNKDYLRDAIIQREYSAYATLIVLTLPTLQQLDIADFAYATMDRLHTVLRNLNVERAWNKRLASPALLMRLSGIKSVSCNFDKQSGLPYSNARGRLNLDQILNLHGLNSLEFSVTERQEAMRRALNPGLMAHLPNQQFVSRVRPTQITRVVVRHSPSCALAVRALLACTPQLQSFTYDISYDSLDRNEAPDRWIDLDAWNTSLNAVMCTLKILVFAVEYFDSGKYAFEQPRIGPRLYGFLNLTGFEKLHTVEVPIPFLTGDVEFSITADIYPLLPPNLRHLSLRLDLSHAQLSYQLDTSILPQDLTLQQSQAEARCTMSARMDLSYTYHATLALLEHATNLESISVWQPADPSLTWFEGQVADFATTCRNKSVTGFMLFPMLLRRRKPEHRDLVEEIMFSPSGSKVNRLERLQRQERAGIPLGLASQYHLRGLQSHLVRNR
ncbi:uncharacterized protein EKO05_0008482 [Ascochyta rabiei]|uniref:Uncharacterized protein n=1 Tax=Didymella rabiei TaxID=5454 RepID=A0A163H667_DIDRA|nr:uncharacterized protein EKO05_0008482 [Ascochyta rabiei]KZM25181.1 hypothetical protein ST47_g3692 [Ascochyta rabiei]UPX18176.1 hypothetical protein EKO05_0008482 [Ascochyta rabiei]